MIETNFCVWFMNNMEGEGVTEGHKQKFITELKKLHSEGFYLVNGKDNIFKTSNKKPETLQRQIETFDQMIDSLFEKI